MVTRNQEMGCVVYFRPNQIMLTSTNNRTEHFNRELKTEELVDYKKCSLVFPSVMYHRYVKLNIRYSDEYKKYKRSLPTYLRNRPKNIIDQLLMTKGAVDHAMVRSVESISRTCYSVKSSDLKEERRKNMFLTLVMNVIAVAHVPIFKK